MAVDVKLVDPTPGMIDAVIAALRPEDAAEIERAGSGVWDCVEGSEFCRVLLLDDEPAAIGGMNTDDPLWGAPWVYSTPVVDRHPRAYLAASRVWLEALLLIRPYLGVMCDARYEKATRWLVWLGFMLDGPHGWGPHREPFWRARIGGMYG